MLQEPGRTLDLAGANKHGQQLFFASMHFQRHRTHRIKPANWWKTPEAARPAAEEAHPH